MTTLKQDIALVRKAVKVGDAMVLFDDLLNDRAYGVLKRICDAAEKTLPKTVKKWTVECDRLMVDGSILHMRHDNDDGNNWVPYSDKAGAVQWAKSLIEQSPYSNISVIEVEVDDK
jgi:hypothetical protein